MNKKQLEYLTEVIHDCLKLKKDNDLTEHGRGQLLVAQTVMKLEREHDPETCPGCIEAKEE